METILIIDDETPILNMFRLLLEFYGYRVLTANNGEKGVEVFQNEKPPIVFLDLKMPGIDGFEVLRRIKETAPKTDVIVITGHGDEELEKKARSLQANDFIHKPFQQKTLDDALRRICKISTLWPTWTKRFLRFWEASIASNKWFSTC